MNADESSVFRDETHATASICNGCTANSAATIHAVQLFLVSCLMRANTSTALNACSSRFVA